MTIDTNASRRGQGPTSPFLRAIDETARHSAVLSTQIGIGRARKAIVGVLDLWDVSPPHDRRWERVFRTWLTELERAER